MKSADERPKPAVTLQFSGIASRQHDASQPESLRCWQDYGVQPFVASQRATACSGTSLPLTGSAAVRCSLILSLCASVPSAYRDTHDPTKLSWSSSRDHNRGNSFRPLRVCSNANLIASRCRGAAYANLHSCTLHPKRASILRMQPHTPSPYEALTAILRRLAKFQAGDWLADCSDELFVITSSYRACSRRKCA